MTGKFIVFEGTDGAGKSAMIEATRKHLTAKEISATFVQDPGGTAIGTAIRKILLNPEFTSMTPLTELLLYSSSRNQLVNELIIPALQSKQHVISDRFIYSTLAYQGASGLIPNNILLAVTSAGADNLMPDHVIFLDLPAETGMKRISGAKDRMENKGIEYMNQVRQSYKESFRLIPPQRLHIIDAAQEKEEVEKAVLELVDEIL